MKFAFCLIEYFPYGGMQRDFLKIALESHRRGHEIHVYTTLWTGKKPDWLVVHLLQNQAKSNHQHVKYFSEDIQDTLNAKKYDVILGFNKIPNLDIYFAADSCFIAKPKYRLFFKRLLPRYRTYVELEKSVFSPLSQTQILSISPAQTHEYKKYYHTPENRFHDLPPGVPKLFLSTDKSSKTRTLIRKQYNLTEDMFLVLSIGSNYKTKGIDRVIKSIANLPLHLKKKTRIFIVGHEKKKSFYLNMTKSLKINRYVYFLGAQDDIKSLLWASDLLIHVARSENTGAVIVEAIVAETPVLVTENCGYAYHVKQADAGKCLNMPFQQCQLNQYLESMLDKSNLKIFRHNSIKYHKSADLYNLVPNAVDVIERIAYQKLRIK